MKKILLATAFLPSIAFAQGPLAVAPLTQPITALHYAPNDNFPSGTFALQPYGFNLADVSNVSQVDGLPSGVKGLVFVGLSNGVDSAFLSFMAPFMGSHPHLWGFYLLDEPDPNVVTAASIKAQSDWIHANIPGAKTFIVLQNMGTPESPTYYPTPPAQGYTPENTDLDYFGLDPYPVRDQFAGGIDLSVINVGVSAATDAPPSGLGVAISQVVPVYQAFGGGGFASWTLPTEAQTYQILSTWGQLVPSPVFDYAYSWGVQNADSAIENTVYLQQVYTWHNSFVP